MNNPELAAVFSEAADSIRANGLLKGTFVTYRGPAGTLPVMDPLGALSQAITGKPVPPDAFDQCDDLYQEAVWFLSSRISSPVVDDDPEERIADWGDHEDRTADQVVAALTSAAVAVVDLPAGLGVAA
ncbi:hypothetical protein [Streptomyces sp. NPDC059994]|uniref:DUF6197 family protein n=1 Tax=Streptomyces sp. NPDC059994 TaxID=3347029 RepID=UPI0036C4C71B